MFLVETLPADPLDYVWRGLLLNRRLLSNDPRTVLGQSLRNGWLIDKKLADDDYLSFAPHESATVSLDKVADEITNADRSVLYAVMQLGGGGRVMEALQQEAEVVQVPTAGQQPRGDHLALALGRIREERLETRSGD